MVGMGDLRQFEGQQPLQDSVAQVLIPITGGSASSRPLIGMGDLRLFEVQQQSSSYVGMGDLRRFESSQQLNEQEANR